MAFHETGPIVTPSEAESLPVRITRNCQWNRCEFCPVYKGKTYEQRPIDETLNDIVISQAMQEFRGRPYESAFLQDADPIALPTSDLILILRKIKEVYPKITKITSYGRAYSIKRKSLEELKELHDAGLTGIYRGLESGYNQLLRYIKKGTTSEVLIESGIKVKQAGIELSDFVMPGLGGNLKLDGQETWRKNAEETARVINVINPDYIRLRTLYVHSNTPLWIKAEKGEFKRASNQEIAKEIRLFIEKLNRISSNIESNFISNIVLFEGKFPEDKEKIISIIDRYIKAPSRRDREYEHLTNLLTTLY